MKTLVSGIAGAALLLSGIAVHAATQEGSAIDPKIHSHFTKLDVNKDGYIEKTEANKDKHLSAAFDKIAKDGKLDEASYSSWKVAQEHPSHTSSSMN